MDFFYGDLMTNQIWKYTNGTRSAAQEADQRWIKNNYCVLFITYLENSSPFQQQKITIKNENGIKFEFKRINCLVIDAKRYFTDWLIKNELVSITKENEITGIEAELYNKISESDKEVSSSRKDSIGKIAAGIERICHDRNLCDKLIAAFSYHTFVFPFYVEHASDVDKWKKALKKSDCWERDIWSDMLTSEKMQPRDILENYALYQYLTDVGRKAVFDYDEEDDGIVSSWKIEDKYVRNVGIYEITKGEDKYQLVLNSLRLKIYNTNIALFIIEAQNCYYSSLKDIKRINEFGRRIFEPFLMSDGAICIECADEQRFFIPGLLENESQDVTESHGTPFVTLENGNVKFNYVNFNPSQVSRSVPIKGLADFIKEILVLGLEKETEIVYGQSKTYGRKNAIKIKPAVDDRMFVVSMVLNGNLIKKAKKRENDGYAYLEDPEVSAQIYALFAVDQDDATCQSVTMRKALLEEFIDSRWIEYGTIHGVTHQSFMALTSETAPDASVISPFLNMYVEMVNLALAQRASLLQFAEDLRKLSQGFEKGSSSKMKRRTVNDLIALQERYAAFQAQILIAEPTVQEQGVELYEMLQKELGIEKNKAEMTEKIKDLCEIADIHQESKLNRYAFWFGVVGTFLALGSLDVASSVVASFLLVLTGTECTELLSAGILKHSKYIAVGAFVFVLIVLSKWCWCSNKVRRCRKKIVKKIDCIITRKRNRIHE